MLYILWIKYIIIPEDDGFQMNWLFISHHWALSKSDPSPDLWIYFLALPSVSPWTYLITWCLAELGYSLQVRSAHLLQHCGVWALDDVFCHPFLCSALLLPQFMHLPVLPKKSCQSTSEAVASSDDFCSSSNYLYYFSKAFYQDSVLISFLHKLS